MKVISAAFKEGELIPRQYTCEGKDVPPPISWQDFPQEAKSFVLIMDDPDAPAGTFTHWVVYDIPSSVSRLEENFPKVKEHMGIKQGMNDFGRVGYGGPCPPRGHGYHRYFFKVYALSVASLNLPAGASRRDVEKAMAGKVLAQAQLMGRYKRD